MNNITLLSIVVPTYNRAPQLKVLLQSLSDLVEVIGGGIEIIICDNCSTDETSSLIAEFCDVMPSFSSIRRSVNIGMEGNIACAMFEGSGKYIWMLSDHQIINVESVAADIPLLSKLEFDIGHAHISQWGNALNDRNRQLVWSALSDAQRGAFLFSIGNLSTLIVRREIVEKAAREIFLCCYSGYPHVGVVSQLVEGSAVVEFHRWSSFQPSNHTAPLRYSYNKIVVRYNLNYRVTREMCGNRFAFSRRAFFTDDYDRSFRGDVLSLLLDKSNLRVDIVRSLIPVVAINSLKNKMIALFVCTIFATLPQRARIKMAETARDVLRKRRNVTT